MAAKISSTARIATTAKASLMEETNIGTEEIPVVITSLSFKSIHLDAGGYIVIESEPAGIPGTFPAESFSDVEKEIITSFAAMCTAKLAAQVNAGDTPSIPNIRAI